ncbi:MAG: LysM peptidoglycan-binding domain-containing protein [candidate division Zixibacteria bacterium]|nr:LysM peptidoglycan-binding domain-containing protein [candidate division Zixibacteria bacterium]
MSKPTPGQQYVIVSGDTLGSIAARAYGDSTFSSRIQSANPSITSPDNIVVGQTVIIPVLSERELLKTQLTDLTLKNESATGLRVLLEGVNIEPISVTITRTMDTCADGWVATIPHDTESLIYEKTAPYRYTPVAVYIGGNLVVNGVLCTSAPSLATDRSIALTGYSYTIDLVDSTIQPPYQRDNITLDQLAQSLVTPIGINAVINGDTGGAFDRITAEKTNTLFTHLLKYARQRGFLVTNTNAGDLLLTQANTEGKSVGTLQEGDGVVLSWGAEFDGRKRFNTYTALGQSPKSNKNVSPAIDNAVPRSRFLTFTADDTTAGNVSQAAIWRRNSQVSKALNMSLPVRDWFDPSGNLWEPNMLVTIISKTIYIPEGFDMLIRAVDYNYSASGRSATLHVVPPQVYTSQEIIEPWD